MHIFYLLLPYLCTEDSLTSFCARCESDDPPPSSTDRLGPKQWPVVRMHIIYYNQSVVYNNSNANAFRELQQR